MKKVQGIILYEGISPIDNKTPIAVIVTGFKNVSRNPKTGNMLQVWIIRSDMHPAEALQYRDIGLCGGCPHRLQKNGVRTCYVNIMGPSSVYRAYKAGKYCKFDIEKHTRLFKFQTIRWGAYGDPYCIPYSLLAYISQTCLGHTGYTHQWKRGNAQKYKQYLQASVDNITEFCQAKDLGWGTFRVRAVDSDLSLTEEKECEGGKNTTCNICRLCDGALEDQKHIVLTAHGNRAAFVAG